MYQEGHPPQSREPIPSHELQRRTERVERVLGNLPLAMLYFSTEERLAQKFVVLPSNDRVDVHKEMAAGILTIQRLARSEQVDITLVQNGLDEVTRRLERALTMLSPDSSEKERFNIDRERFKTQALLYEVRLLSDVLTTMTGGRLVDNTETEQQKLITDPLPVFTPQEFLPPDATEPATEEAEEERGEHRFTGGERSLLARHLFESRGWPYRSFVGMRREGQRRTLPYEALHVRLPEGREAAVFLNDGTEQATYVVRDLPFGELGKVGGQSKKAFRAMRETNGRVNWFGAIDNPQEWELQLAHLLLKDNEEPVPDLSSLQAHPWTNRKIRDEIQRQAGYGLASNFVDRLANVWVNHFGESPDEIGRVMLRSSEPSLCFTERMAQKIIDIILRYRNPDTQHWKTLRGTLTEATAELKKEFDYETIRKVAQHLSAQDTHREEDEAYFFSSGGSRDATTGSEEENPWLLSRYFSPTLRERIIECLRELMPPEGWQTIHMMAVRSDLAFSAYNIRIEVLEKNLSGKMMLGGL